MCTFCTLCTLCKFALCALFQKMLCTSEIILNRRVHLARLNVATAGGRRVSSIHLHRHTSGYALKKPAPTRWKLVPRTVDGSSGKVHIVHKECTKCKKCRKCNPQFADESSFQFHTSSCVFNLLSRSVINNSCFYVPIFSSLN